MTNEEKQIEEMAKVLEATCDETECNKPTNCDLCQATRLYNKGYRKASDVARGIFADIKSIWKKGRGFIKYTDLVDLARIYENKYESEGGGK